MKISITIPAHNEQDRIGRTLEHYIKYFNDKKKAGACDYELVIVLNACTDNTLGVVKRAQKDSKAVRILDLPQGGKGLAVVAGFKDALTRNNDYIGFVDADMATKPEAFYDLVKKIPQHHGIIASRYMKGAQLHVPRPLFKRWGTRLIYEPFVWLLFGLSYKDLQCGAKLFQRKVIETIISKCTVKRWAFDVEILYLCRKNKFIVKETPTKWRDQAGSKLSTVKDGIRMFTSLIKLRLKHPLF